MSSTASVASDDLEIFKSISNPEKVAIADVPVHVERARSPLRGVPEVDDEFGRVPPSPLHKSVSEDSGNDSDGESRASSAPSRDRMRERSDDEDSIAPVRRASRTTPSPRHRETGAFSSFVASRSGGRRGHETEEMLLNKQSLIHDIERMKLQGVQFSRNWAMDDDYDDMNFEMKRVLMNLDEASQVAMMRNTMQLACTGVEMLSRRIGLLSLEGWSTEMSEELAKQDRTLGRLYRKYWRRSAQSQPEWDLAMAVVGSAGMFHFRKSFSRRMEQPRSKGAPQRRAPPSAPSPRVEEPVSSDDESLPP